MAGFVADIDTMDSTIRSNLTVGPPVDLLVYRRDALEAETRLRIEEDDPYFLMIRSQWSESLRDAYLALPDPPWSKRKGRSKADR